MSKGQSSHNNTPSGTRELTCAEVCPECVRTTLTRATSPPSQRQPHTQSDSPGRKNDKLWPMVCFNELSKHMSHSYDLFLYSRFNLLVAWPSLACSSFDFAMKPRQR